MQCCAVGDSTTWMSSRTTTIGPSSVSAFARAGSSSRSTDRAPAPQDLDRFEVDRADRLERLGEVPQQVHGLVVETIEIDPHEVPIVRILPEEHRRRLPVARGCEDHDRRGVARRAEQLGEVLTRDHTRAWTRTAPAARWLGTVERHRRVGADVAGGHGSDVSHPVTGGAANLRNVFAPAGPTHVVVTRSDRLERRPSPHLGEDGCWRAASSSTVRRTRGVECTKRLDLQSRTELPVSEPAADEPGPIDYLVVEFPGRKTSVAGAMATELASLVDAELIRMLDLVIIEKGTDGSYEVQRVRGSGRAGPPRGPTCSRGSARGGPGPGRPRQRRAGTRCGHDRRGCRLREHLGRTTRPRRAPMRRTTGRKRPHPDARPRRRARCGTCRPAPRDRPSRSSSPSPGWYSRRDRPRRRPAQRLPQAPSRRPAQPALSVRTTDMEHA